MADYADVVTLWPTEEGVEVAEGDDEATISSCLARNAGLSRVVETGGKIVAAILCGHDESAV